MRKMSNAIGIIGKSCTSRPRVEGADYCIYCGHALAHVHRGKRHVGYRCDFCKKRYGKDVFFTKENGRLGREWKARK